MFDEGLVSFIRYETQKKKNQLKNMGKTFEQIASPKKVHGWQIST